MIIAFNSRSRTRKHVMFGQSSTFEDVTYCGIYYLQWRGAHAGQKRCKRCTRELKKAGMSWRWYEQQERQAKKNARAKRKTKV